MAATQQESQASRRREPYEGDKRRFMREGKFVFHNNCFLRFHDVFKLSMHTTFDIIKVLIMSMTHFIMADSTGAWCE